jgi:ComF family protein
LRPETGDKARWCAHCPTRPIHFDSAFAAAAYRGAARDAVKALKFHGRMEMGALMARRMTLALDEEQERLGPTAALIPVPLHFFRRVHRGFNQSEVLARGVGGMAGLTVLDRALVRAKFTRQQTLLDYDARRRNVAGAFRVADPGAVRGRAVLLIDDVLTSGATVNECARVLRDAGAAAIHVFTFARAA